MRRPLRRYSINTATLGFRTPLSDTIEAVARAGFGGIAPWRREMEDIDPRLVARQIQDAGLRVSGYCRSTYFPAATKEERLRNIEDNKVAVRVAGQLGADCFVLVVGGLPPGSRDLDDARHQVEEGIRALMSEAAVSGVQLAIEPLHPMYAADRACVNTIEQALDIAERLDPDGNRLGVAIDVYHTWWDPRLSTMIRRAGREGRILAYHVNDWLVPTADLLNDRGLPGEGVIDLQGIGQQIDDAGYNGLFEVEIFSERLWKLPVDHVLRMVAENSV